jgi:hypothetical protein
MNLKNKPPIFVPSGQTGPHVTLTVTAIQRDAIGRCWFRCPICEKDLCITEQQAEAFTPAPEREKALEEAAKYHEREAALLRQIIDGGQITHQAINHHESSAAYFRALPRPNGATEPTAQVEALSKALEQAERIAAKQLTPPEYVYGDYATGWNNAAKTILEGIRALSRPKEG